MTAQSRNTYSCPPPEDQKQSSAPKIDIDLIGSALKKR